MHVKCCVDHFQYGLHLDRFNCICLPITSPMKSYQERGLLNHSQVYPYVLSCTKYQDTILPRPAGMNLWISDVTNSKALGADMHTLSRDIPETAESVPIETVNATALRESCHCHKTKNFLECSVFKIKLGPHKIDKFNMDISTCNNLAIWSLTHYCFGCTWTHSPQMHWTYLDAQSPDALDALSDSW